MIKQNRGDSIFFLQMAGSPGCGKSTLAKEVAKETNAIIVDHDVIKSAILEAENDSVSLNDAGKVSYKVDWSLVDLYLSQGFSVIFDVPCFYEIILEKGQELARKYQAQYKFVECYLDDIDEVDKRLRNRENLRCQYDEVPTDTWLNEKYKEHFNKSLKPQGDFLTVDTSYPLESCIDDVLTYLNDETESHK